MTEHGPDYTEALGELGASYDTIINTPLTVLNIDRYADNALTQLIGLVHETVEKYKSFEPITSSEPTEDAFTEKELEDAACEYFGLEDISETLNHIASKAEQISHLDTVIARARRIKAVIVPPGPMNVEITPGSGTYEKPRTVPKLKTILFILANEFLVDVEDEEQLSLTDGEADASMMRGNSYYVAHATNLDRTVLVNDEVGNITYVFNDAVLRNELDIDPAELLRMPKPDLDALLARNPRAGQRVQYSRAYVPQIILALQQPNEEAKMPHDTEVMGRYLVPNAPENILSLFGIVKALGLRSHRGASKAVQDLGPALGVVKEYRFGPRIVAGYKTIQQQQIREYLDKKGYLGKPTEGSANRRQMAKKWRVAPTTITNAITELGDELGPVGTYAGTRGPREFFDLNQQDLVHEKLKERGLLNPERPDTHKTVSDMAKELNLGGATVDKIIDELGDELGEVKTYKNKHRVSKAYSPEQQILIYFRLLEKGLLPEQEDANLIDLFGFAKKLGFKTRDPIYGAIDHLRSSIGEVKMYRFSGKKHRAKGLTTAQQNMIEDFLRESGRLPKID